MIFETGDRVKHIDGGTGTLVRPEGEGWYAEWDKSDNFFGSTLWAKTDNLTPHVDQPESDHKTASIIVDEPFVMVVIESEHWVPLATGHDWVPPMTSRDVERARALLTTALKQLDQVEQDREASRIMQESGANVGRSDED